MAINFPNNPSNGAQHTASGITWTYDGTTWKADGVTGSYVLPTASATVLGGIKVGSGLTINAGVLATTGGGGGGSQTLDQVLANGNTTTRDIDTTGKIKFSNNYANLGDLPSASTYHGMFAHVHGEGAAYYAHAGAWVRLADYSHTHTTPSLDQVLAVGNTTTRDIITTGKILYSNNYANLGDLPSPSTYHGMFAHVHGEGHGYYSHAGAWVQLLDTSSSIEELGNVTISSPSTGQVLKYNGSAWVNDTDATGGGGGGSLTIQDEGSSLSTAATTINFTGAGVTASGTGATKTITIAGGGGSSYTNSDVDAHLNTSSASSNQILSWNGSDYAWVNDQTGGGSGLASRTTGAATASSLANDASANLTITAAKTYALHKIQTSHAAWVTLYTDTTSRTQDANRTDSTDPVAGSGVIAEVITSDGATQKITPGAIGYNDDGTPSTNAYVKVVNKSGNTANLTVTLHFVSLEA